jgi:flavin reductase (DIM6/NTAB) family NADH-FMN oxidoreductase RutF
MNPASEPVFNWLPCPVVFITSTDGARRDIMTATAMFVSEKEPLLQVSVARNHLTEKLILASLRFTVVIAGHGQRGLALQVGAVKGSEVDKIEKFKIPLAKAAPAEALVPEGAAAWLACAVESSLEITGYRLFIGRVTSQGAFETPPLVWRSNAFFTLKPA